MRLVVLILLFSFLGSPDPVGAQKPVTEYVSPVSGTIIRAFGAPSSYYGAGSRGIRYRSRPGQPVRAANDGVVVFAGSVADEVAVTIKHPDGLVTTVSSLGTADVDLGMVVSRGEVIGVSSATTIFTARAGRAYIDAGALLSQSPPRARLVR